MEAKIREVVPEVYHTTWKVSGENAWNKIKRLAN
jgi:hypothetical protein